MDYYTHWIFVIGRFAPVPGDTVYGGREQIIFSNDHQECCGAELAHVRELAGIAR
jgi:hypothetical protein